MFDKGVITEEDQCAFADQGPVVYKGMTLDADLRLDLLVDESIIVEVKAVEAINRVYEAQVLSYMKLLQKPKGMIINFCCTSIFHSGQKTFVNDLFSDLR